jgi:hypothetical protein
LKAQFKKAVVRSPEAFVPLMERPLIAVIGDATKSSNPAVAKQAGRELGVELARRDCRILVFSSSENFIEWEAVQGYRSSNKKLPAGSIEIRYPPNLHSLFPGEKPDDPAFLRRQQTGDWEASIYPSFAEIDGIVLLGGAYTTKIAGLLAMGSKTPIVTLAGLGGSAYQVWNFLKSDRNSPTTDEDLDLMAKPEWGDSSAFRLVDCLINQIERRQERARQAALGENERHRQRVLTTLAIVGSGCFLTVLFSLTQLPALSSHSFGFRCLLLIAPAVAGASGAAIRVLWDNWSQSAVPLVLRPIGMTIVLGFWAAGVLAAVFLLEQLWVSGNSTNDTAGKFLGAGVTIGLIAGLTLNRVFPKLIQMEVPARFDVHGNGESASQRRRATRNQKPD